ncbi:adult cuticle protein [Culex quinquefasciatus]|uniref:Adult cuticle protein n=1 Tax=Culex quinquefasciatus TaxID=7176 RepID=B0X227_CULQU|nr:adult cuticle protein [Culex quinquefasciatus]|eukprot:XP_001863699.1 adult cuticle protein [Culex quinquefasciatus]
MKYLLAVVILITVSCVASFRRSDHQVSEYRYKTVHILPEKKLVEENFEEKLEVLSKILKKQQQSRKTDVSVKAEITAKSEEKLKVDSYEEPKKDEKVSVPRYEFSYGVRDPKTGDQKEQWEKRIGGQVRGQYKFAESDGTQRVVEYEADDDKGFEAKVKNVEQGKFSEEKEEKVDTKFDGGEKVAESYSYLKKYY